MFNREALRGARAKAGLTLHALSATADVGATTIHQLEVGSLGNPRMSTLSKLAAALNVDPASFFTNSHQVPDVDQVTTDAGAA
jgi:transcriptional regulator with XRE-family HTH domain